jgi:hypothetical protein
MSTRARDVATRQVEASPRVQVGASDLFRGRTIEGSAMTGEPLLAVRRGRIESEQRTKRAAVDEALRRMLRRMEAQSIQVRPPQLRGHAGSVVLTDQFAPGDTGGNAERQPENSIAHRGGEPELTLQPLRGQRAGHVRLGSRHEMRCDQDGHGQ